MGWERPAVRRGCRAQERRELRRVVARLDARAAIRASAASACFESETFDPARWALDRAARPVREPSSRRRLLGREAGHGVHGRGRPCSGQHGRVHRSGGSRMDRARAHRAARQDRPLLLRQRPAARRVPRREWPARVRRPRRAIRPDSDRGARTYTARWFRFVNDTRRAASAARGRLLPGARRGRPGRFRQLLRCPYRSALATIPSATSRFMCAAIAPAGHQVVGVERGWPGKMLADPNRDVDSRVRRFADLAGEQQQLYAPYATADAASRGRQLTAAEHFDTQAISERTTYDAVTHALAQLAADRREGRVDSAAHSISSRARARRRSVLRPQRRPAVPPLRRFEAGRRRHARSLGRVLPWT